MSGYFLSGYYSPSCNVSGVCVATGIMLGVQGYSGSFSYDVERTGRKNKYKTRDDGYSRSASPSSKPSPASPATKIYKDVLVGGFGYS